MALSGYPSNLYDRMYFGWYQTRIAGTPPGPASAWKHRTEIVWTNYPPGVGLFAVDTAS